MLLPKTYATRWPWRAGLLAMLLLLAMSWHFYLERVAYYDLAFHLFTFIHAKSLFIQNRRFVAAVTQLPTLLALRLHWPLWAVMRLYSVVFVLYYLAVYVGSARWLRNEQAALLMPLALVLLGARTFYWAQSELPQALAALVFYYAGVSRQAPVQLRPSSLALAALVPVVIFGHPLAVFPFFFLWAYDWLLNQRWRDWGYYGLLALGLGTYQLRTALIPPGSYEANNMTFGPSLAKYFPHYFSLPSFTEFWHLCATNFLALPVLLVLLSAYYLRQRTWLAAAKLLLVWGFALGYAIVVNVSKPDFIEATYLENLYLPLAFFVAAPLALELLPALEQRAGRRGPVLAAGLLAVLLLARVGYTYYLHTPYTAYQQWLARVLAYTRQFPEQRFVLDDQNADPSRLREGRPWWASAYETALLSARYHPDSAQSVYITQPARVAAAGQTAGHFVAEFDNMDLWDLNGPYFRFTNRSAPYRALTTPPPADTAALRGYLLAHQQTQLRLVDLPRALKAGRGRVARIAISVPPSARPLHAGLAGGHPTLLRSRFLDGDWPVAETTAEVPLEVDVYQDWQQDLALRCPPKPGTYTLEISLLSQGYRDWPVRLRLPVTVE